MELKKKIRKKLNEGDRKEAKKLKKKLMEGVAFRNGRVTQEEGMEDDWLKLASKIDLSIQTRLQNTLISSFLINYF